MCSLATLRMQFTLCIRRREGMYGMCGMCASPLGGHDVQVVCADNGLMPPLSWRAAPHSPEDVFILAESLHHSHALRMKATAIVLTLESKCGSDAFLPIVRSLVKAARDSRSLPVPPSYYQSQMQPQQAAPVAAVGGAAGAAGAAVPWLLTSASFLKQVAQVGGFRREIGSFAERWIYGTGCPSIRGACCCWHYHCSPACSGSDALISNRIRTLCNGVSQEIRAAGSIRAAFSGCRHSGQC
jgi:hypothetical protein